MSLHCDVAIIGGGIMGASISYYLSKMGVDKTLVCEQGRFPGLGATSKSGGFIRTYHTDNWYTERAVESFETFRNWKDIIGGDCGFEKTGFSYISNIHTDQNIKKFKSIAQKSSIPVYFMQQEDFNNVQPFYKLSPNDKIVHEPESGYADPLKATSSLLNQTQNNELLEGIKVINFEITNGRVSGIETNVGTIRADTYILTNSVWINELLCELKFKLPIKRKSIGVGFMSFNTIESPSNLNSYIDDTLDTYFRPTRGNELLFGVKIDNNNTTSVQNQEFPFITKKELINSKNVLCERLPFLKNAIIKGTRLGFDAYTDDGLPFIGEVPGWDNVYSCVGFNGGGFKIAPAVAHGIALEITNKRPISKLDNCRIERLFPPVF
ncbi:NAD(P)/FAD-dependent oxidoreductase (plasmid) [Priestia sp. MF3]|uniref:NAD(P)/FAD-dependent oxidoreductase n=1 Tax=Priestia sp. MF3 TaxID=3404779 RepID=UPI003B9F1B84